MEALYEALLQEGIVQLREEAPFFRWASGRLSPVYLDFRRCLAYPALRQALVEALRRRLEEKGLTFQGVAGVATGGISWAAWLADRLGLPMGYVRSAPKAYGTSRTVEGLLPAHSPVLLIEDVLSTGQSVATAAAHLIEEGFYLAGIAALWDYALPSQEKLPYPYLSVLRFPQALAAWQPHLPSAQYTLLQQWHKTGELPI